MVFEAANALINVIITILLHSLLQVSQFNLECFFYISFGISDILFEIKDGLLYLF